MIGSEKDIIQRMIQLADSKYNCSQILMILALSQAGEDKADLVRAMAGLGNGCGFFYETCGIMTGAASVLAWYGGKGSVDETESEKLPFMLQDLGDWFRQQTAVNDKGTRCKDIVGDAVGTDTGKLICGGLILNTHTKVNEILEHYGFMEA